MFSQKNSALIPTPIRANSSICSQANQYSSGVLPSSEDMYSQSQRYINIVPGPEPNHSCDYWSQSRQLRRGFQMHDPQRRNTHSNTSINNFYDLQKERDDFNGKEIISNVAHLLKECTEDVRSSLESMKVGESGEFNSDIEQVVANVSNIEEMFLKFQDNISNNVKNEFEALHLGNDLKETSEKDTELAVKSEKIYHMQKEIDDLSLCYKSTSNQENLVGRQNDKITQLLSCCDSSTDIIKGLCNKNVEYDSMLEQLIRQNKTILQNLSDIARWQKATNNALSTIRSSLTSVNVVNTLDGSVPQGYVKTVTLPGSNVKNGTVFSPLPQHTRWSDINGKPSQAAIVQPIVQPIVSDMPEIKQGKTQSPHLPKKVFPIFDMSSDSDSGQELHELVSKLVKEPSKRQKKYKHIKSTADMKPTCGVKATPVIKATPDVKQVGKDSAFSPYIQRSIRRYGKIKKFVNLFSPLPMTKSTSNYSKTVNTSSHHINKKLITLNDHWTSANPNINSVR